MKPLVSRVLAILLPLLVAFLPTLLSPRPALAGLTERELAAVELVPPPGARIPLGLAFRDSEGRNLTLGEALGGRPALLLPADYACRTTCGPALSILSGALVETGLRPGTDFRLILVGLNPDARAGEPRSFVNARIGDAALAAATSALVGEAASVRALTQAIGYRYAEDPGNRAFAHPTGLVAVTSDGRVARALSSLALDPTDLRLALLEAGEGRMGGVAGRLALLCYGFDPVHGIYTARIEQILKIAGVLTVLLMAGTVGWLSWRAHPRGGAS